MGWRNPPVPWSELERRLSDRPPSANGGDSPAWSSRREAFEAPAIVRRPSTVPYAELHCHSNFSFLDGASPPEELAEEAARLGLEALALTDHDGFYGVVRFAEAATAVGLPTVFGSELSLGLSKPQNGEPDPEGTHLLVLARDPQGYGSLGRAIGEAQMAGKEKGKPQFQLSRLAELHGNRWAVLTGCRKGAVPLALVHDGPAAALRKLQDLVAVFGRSNVFVELWDHGNPLDSARNDALVDLAAKAAVGVVATNNAHYAVPARRPLATAMAAVRARRSLDEIDGWLPPAATAHLRSGAEMARRFARYPGAVETAAALGLDCAFDLKLVAPNLPPYPVPPGHTEMSYLRQLTMEGALRRYGPPESERVPGAYRQLEHELALIEQLGFAGYFLVVWDICEFCRRNDIYCQGRGSAANSAVCYAIGVTNADAVGLKLLFERFLSPERDGPPDIDVDIESDRREEAIQYVYGRYGRENAAQVANVITYRPKSAIRDMAKALGHSVGQQDAWSKQADAWGPMSATTSQPGIDIPQPVIELASQIQGYPRHLGIHSGGMVICDRPVVEVCPVEWARMENRSVLQWDKDDCAAVGLVKFDMLGLGMLSALHYCIDLIRDAYGVEIDLATIPQDDAVYDMVCAADTVGVFQIESRAQMATLPRLRPRCFYDLVVEVALIRPGPIQGGSVHPYIRRRNGQEPVTYLHPLLEKSLGKTLGIPLFQEQLMQMAIDVAGFSAGDADQLRQAMGSKRSNERMGRLRQRFYDGMATNGIVGETADAIWEKLAAFANFGFPESHSVSFAYLVYASAWLKFHYPAAFCAALLNAQPMGFWSPQTLCADARRHGVTVLGPDVNASAATATLEPVADGSQGVRLGIGYVRTIGKDLAAQIADGRPYRDMEEVVRRNALTTPQAEALATAGAFGCFDTGDGLAAGPDRIRGAGRQRDQSIGDADLPVAGVDRRRALWAAGAVAQSRPDRLPGIVTGETAPDLPPMHRIEVAAADLWATGISPDASPTEFVRADLDERGVVTAAQLLTLDDRTRVWVAGVVTHRQRPATAGGTIFVSLEDETGLMNVICSKGVWARFRKVAMTAPALVVRGTLERVEEVCNVVADRIEPLTLATSAGRSRDFR